MAAETPKVDTHAHIWGEHMPLWSKAWNRPAYAYPVETYLETLDASGVDFGVIAAASLFSTYNDYTIRALRHHPRLRGTVIVDPDIGLYELEGMHRNGVVGVRLQLFHTDTPDLGSDAYVRLLHRLRDLDMHVHVNVEAHRLADVLAALRPSGVKIVIDHFGWPEAELGLNCPGFRAAVAAGHEGVAWVKLSAGFRRPDQDIARMYAEAYVERLGTERLFWGSDAPFVGMEGQVTHARTLEQFEYWLPDPAVRDAIHRTAYRFYFG
jgi:predicted TIM-barrel fold metal-dependent hydrolase